MTPATFRGVFHPTEAGGATLTYRPPRPAELTHDAVTYNPDWQIIPPKRYPSTEAAQAAIYTLRPLPLAPLVWEHNTTLDYLIAHDPHTGGVWILIHHRPIHAPKDTQ